MTDRDELLDVLIESICEVANLRSLTIGMVDPASRSGTIVRRVYRVKAGGGLLPMSEAGISRESVPFNFSDGGVLPEVARSGNFTVIDGWDPRFSLDGDPSARTKAHFADKVSYFMPVLDRHGVVAVLATASTFADKENTLTRISAMEPLLDQIATRFS
eukprot:UN05935